MFGKFWLIGLTCLSWAQVQEEIKVIVRDVRVHVIDSDGSSVRGLTQEQFQVIEGKRQPPISFFEEVDLDTPPADAIPEEEWGDLEAAPMPRRTMVIFLDSSTLIKPAFPFIIKAIDRFIEEEVNAYDLVKIVQMEDRLHHLTPFTRDRNELKLGLAKANFKGVFTERLNQLEGDVVRALESLMTQEENFNPNNPFDVSTMQSEADGVLRAMDEKERLKSVHFQTYHLNMKVIAGLLDGVPGGKSIFLFTGGAYLQDSSGRHKSNDREMEELTQLFNAEDITVYTFLHTDKDSPAIRQVRGSKFDLSDTHQIKATLEKYVTPNNIRRLQRLESIGNSNSLFENEFQLATAPRLTSENTGGFFLRNASLESLNQTIKDFTQATSHYYRIGYTVLAETQTSKAKIELVNPQKTWKLVYGNEFRKIKPFSDWSKEEIQLSFEVELLHGSQLRNDLDCDFGFKRFASHANRYASSVFAGLTLAKKSKKGLQVGYAALDEAREVLDISQSTVFPTQTGEVMLYNVLVTERQPKYFRFFVRNMDNGEYSISESFVAHEPKVHPKLQMSDLNITPIEMKTLVIPINHLGNKSVPENTSKQNTGNTAVAPSSPREDMDPMNMNGYMVVPQLKETFKMTKGFNVFFHLLNVESHLEKYEVEFHLKNVAQRGDFVKGEILDLRQTSEKDYRCYGLVQLEDTLIPGSYELSIKVLDTVSQESTFKVAAFSIQN